MVKLIEPLNPPPPNVERRTQFFHDLGLVVAIWSQFEVALELTISRRMKLAPADSSLIFGTMGFESKQKIAIAVLARENHREAIDAIKEVVAHVRRNVLLHAALGAESDFSKFAFWQRRLDEAGSIAKHEFTADSFHRRVAETHRKVSAVFDLLKVTETDLTGYARTAGFPGID